MRVSDWVLIVCLSPLLILVLVLMAAFLNRIYVTEPMKALGFAAVFVLAVGGVVASHLLED